MLSLPGPHRYWPLRRPVSERRRRGPVCPGATVTCDNSDAELRGIMIKYVF